MASKQDGNSFRKANWVKAAIAVALIALSAAGYMRFQAWNLERLMTFYAVRSNFSDPASQHFIALVIQGDIDDVLAEAKTVPGGVNATGTDGLTPLMVAVLRLNLPMVKALLAAGANPNGDVKQVPLRTAVRAKDLTIAKTLLEAGANPNGLPGGEPPLIKAALINNKEAVDLLLQAGAWVDAPDQFGKTASMVAALAGHLDMTLYLLDHGGSLWVTETLGITIPILLNNIPTTPELVAAQESLIARYKAAHWPWPPPSSKEVKKLMDEGKWPPQEAKGLLPLADPLPGR